MEPLKIIRITHDSIIFHKLHYDVHRTTITNYCLSKG